jgi:hypothetical protein
MSNLSKMEIALEVAWRGKEFHVCMIVVDSPKSYFQIVALRSFDVTHRIETYLPNSRDARRIGEDAVVDFSIIFLGFCESSDFRNIKYDLRKRIGPEGNPNLRPRIQGLISRSALEISMTHRTSKGISEREPSSQLLQRSILTIAAGLRDENWIINV